MIKAGKLLLSINFGYAQDKYRHFVKRLGLLIKQDHAYFGFGAMPIFILFTL